MSQVLIFTGNASVGILIYMHFCEYYSNLLLLNELPQNSAA